MRILVLGANGLLGSAVSRELLAQGHHVTGFGRQPVLNQTVSGLAWCSGDFSRRTRARHWRSELPGVDVLINTIGVFSERFLQTFSVIHDEAPRALWEACEQYGVRRVIHVSALGAALDAPTEYWRSKARGDAALLERTALPACVVRPSLIYAEQGVSTRLFHRWAALPVLPVPRSAAEIQPIHCQDVASLLAGLACADEQPATRVLEVAGPERYTVPEWLQALRSLQGRKPAPVMPVPDWLASLGAWIGEHHPGGLVSRESLRMLQRGSVVNDAQLQRVQELVGRPLWSARQREH